NSANAAAVMTSNCVADSASGRTRASAASMSAGASSTWIRSAQPRTCGEMYAPTRSPASRRSAAIISEVEVFPFVPTTWIAGYESCGSPSAWRSCRIPPSPNSSGQGERLSSQTTPSLPVERLELTAVALELLALGLHDLRRGLGHEALVREHPFG